MGPTGRTRTHTEAQLTKLAGAMDEEHQLDGTDIIEEGDEGKTFYVSQPEPPSDHKRHRESSRAS